MAQRQVFDLTATSPVTQSTTAIGATVHGMLRFDRFAIDANLQGGAGGTLDVYLQRQIADDLWADWCHFPQLADSAAAIQYSAQNGVDNTIRVVEQGTDASAGTPALAANTFIGGHPGSAVRMVFVTGAGVTGGAEQVVKITGWQDAD